MKKKTNTNLKSISLGIKIWFWRQRKNIWLTLNSSRLLQICNHLIIAQKLQSSWITLTIYAKTCTYQNHRGQKSSHLIRRNYLQVVLTNRFKFIRRNIKSNNVSTLWWNKMTGSNWLKNRISQTHLLLKFLVLLLILPGRIITVKIAKITYNNQLVMHD